MKKPQLNLFFVVILIVGIVPVASARQAQSGQPIPAYHSPLAGAADNGNAQDADTQNLAPDTRALTGAQNFSIGVPLATHSYWQPRFNLSATADSNALQASGNTGWTTWTSVSGGFDFHRQTSASDMNLTYLAGGMFSNSGTAANGLIQGLSFQDKLLFRRSTLLFFDALNYLPESPFGFAGLGGGVPLPGTGILGGNFAPGQTALTPRGKNLTNSFVTEFDESLTARTSLTFVGGYSLLHSIGNDLFNYSNATFQAGYNHQMSLKNTIGLSDLFSALRYSNFNQSINTNTVTGSFGRRVTGRLGFQVSGGPEVVFSSLPVTGNPAANSTTKLYWSAQSSLQYQLRGTGLRVAYSRGVTGGSGVLPGALANTISGSVNQQLTRTTNVLFNFGYSRNTGISQTTTIPANQSFNYSYGGATLNRALGRELNINLTYQAQYQVSNVSSCVGPACGASVLRHLITLGVGWQRQAIPIE